MVGLMAYCETELSQVNQILKAIQIKIETFTSLIPGESPLVQQPFLDFQKLLTLKTEAVLTLLRGNLQRW